MTDDGTRWYALRVHPQKEFVVSHLLRQRGLYTYVPTELRARRRNRYAKSTDQLAFPLIPGCIFVGFSGVPEWYGVTTNPLVFGILGHGGEPWRLDTVELLWWRARVPDGCLVFRPGFRLIQVESKGQYRSPLERPRLISARGKKGGVVEPNRIEGERFGTMMVAPVDCVADAA